MTGIYRLYETGSEFLITDTGHNFSNKKPSKKTWAIGLKVWGSSYCQFLDEDHIFWQEEARQKGPRSLNL